MEANVSQRLITTGVGPLQVRTQGDGDHPTAVLWHSLFVDDRSWDRVIPDLSSRRQLVVITGPGHGASGDPGHRYTMQDCADAAVTVLEALGVRGPVDWLGNAWGGHVGVVIAAQRPELMRTLVTAGTPVHAYPLASRVQTQALLTLYRLLGPRTFLTDAVVDALLSQRTREHDAAAAALVRDCFVTADRAGMANAVVSISLRRRDLRPLLPAVQAPTLFLTGSDHPDWSPTQARTAAALLPHGSTGVVDGAAYLAPLENPSEFTRQVLEFWAACSVARS
jgi:pimeloyl-ACP methyl ester carboxylesterase